MFWRTIICDVTSDLKNEFGKKMELAREHFSSIIFYNFRRGLSRQECIDELKSLFGDKAPSNITVKTGFMNSILDDGR